ncbi:hypothetical protein A3SI_10704 [Nitritalea halalkaliphila LW7]|uniref:Uncharacterized protein n=1 Tax=Nitritalea halalkaliphila LW7 TaxID=1189621 RepID=I5C378_9BACT|nr:hypothetical protein [Nitritalea halalkaliphila]EIM76280.1 hypothetical protein A3SI_10704 [Nitritalea halalkaliphila LW7]
MKKSILLFLPFLLFAMSCDELLNEMATSFQEQEIDESFADVRAIQANLAYGAFIYQAFQERQM